MIDLMGDTLWSYAVNRGLPWHYREVKMPTN